MDAAARWLDGIRSLKLPRPLKVMNVCGGHERALTLAGLRRALPPDIQIIPGPGCPVCVCPEEAVYEAIQIALERRAILVAFGDMLRVPVNVPNGEPRSLEQARAAGGDVRAVASPREALTIARESHGRPLVFFAAGFETTMAPVSALLCEGVPDNLYLLLAGRLTWPAVALLLESEHVGDDHKRGFDALIAPGHVATVMGPEEWRFVPERHGIPTAIAGFTSESLLAALYSVLSQCIQGAPFLDNCYPQVVHPGGNPEARRQLGAAMRIVDANWRGIGSIPCSGFELAERYADRDARSRFPATSTGRARAGQMPAGCDCARVVLGKITPDACRLYGRACRPRTPVGPCMVSDEGACRIWWSAGIRESRAAHVQG